MRVFYFLFLSLFIASCDCSEDPQTDECKDIIISQSQFNNLDPNQASVSSLSIEDDCLTVMLGVGGCDTNHDIDMISDGSIAESFPPQITFDFKDLDLQACNAFFQIERQFDLSEIGSVQDGDIWINFRNSDIRILYTP